MAEFDFLTDGASKLYCEQIVVAMELLYDIAPDAGYALLNERWQGKDWRTDAKFAYLLYHERQEEWARRIGNPKPCGGADEELDQWAIREDEANARIESLRNDLSYQWLWPLDW